MKQSEQPSFPEAWQSCQEWWAKEGLPKKFKWLFRDQITSHKRHAWFLDISTDGDQAAHARWYQEGRAQCHSLSIVHYGISDGFSLSGIDVPDLLIAENARSSGGHLDFKICTSPYVWHPVSSPLIFLLLHQTHRVLRQDAGTRSCALPARKEKAEPF